MKIDITSMFFNSRIEGQTATPAWGTSIGQNRTRECRIDDFKPEIVDVLMGMTYKSINDIANFDVSRVSSSREILMYSVFSNIYINNQQIEDAQYVLLLVREHSRSHEGRLLVTYAPYITYNNISNQVCIDKMREFLGCTDNGCWFVYDITVKNQSDLYFNAVVVNSTAPAIYSNSSTSRNRTEEWRSLIPESSTAINLTFLPHQQIFYGAPGTGKSHTIKRVVEDGNLPHIRTTFHPDSDYSTFVGAYKPTTIDVPMRDVSGHIIVEDGKQVIESKIIYTFVPQAFLKAYVAAWKNQNQPFFLIIEEINRGNCAQIFGDLFQLLDRNSEGVSDYPVTPDDDIRKHLKGVFSTLDDTLRASIPDEILSGEIMRLPKNLYIWATMNTSDQSLFPIDSAFKRRWDWKYTPIANGNKDWKITADGKEYDWWQFLEKINTQIGNATHSEDKKLGYYFCKPVKGKTIDAETFVSKVVFYLWNDVFKDFAEDAGSIFNDEDGTVLSFNKFYTTGTDGNAVVVEQKVTQFLQNLGVDPLQNVE